MDFISLYLNLVYTIIPSCVNLHISVNTPTFHHLLWDCGWERGRPCSHLAVNVCLSICLPLQCTFHNMLLIDHMCVSLFLLLFLSLSLSGRGWGKVRFRLKIGNTPSASSTLSCTGQVRTHPYMQQHMFMHTHTNMHVHNYQTTDARFIISSLFWICPTCCQTFQQALHDIAL